MVSMNFAPKLGSTRSETALFLIAVLVALYAISQFLRNSIGVIANDLARELHLSATQTGLLSSAFFFAFAAVQIPIGILIDRYGPKQTMLATAVLTVAGTVLFALAPSASMLIAARALMGLGCSTFFMAPLVIYARRFPPERFAGLTSLQMGLANIGTLAATAPLAASAAMFGWRSSFLAIAVLTVVIVLAIIWIVPRDSGSERPKETWTAAFRGVTAALKVPSFRPVFFMHLTTYGCFASVIGLWGGPWLSDGANLRHASLGRDGPVLGQLQEARSHRQHGDGYAPRRSGPCAARSNRGHPLVPALWSLRRLYPHPHQPRQVAVPSNADRPGHHADEHRHHGWGLPVSERDGDADRPDGTLR
jgi:predicted MFS family arabinose efflux permease